MTDIPYFNGKRRLIAFAAGVALLSLVMTIALSQYAAAEARSGLGIRYPLTADGQAMLSLILLGTSILAAAVIGLGWKSICDHGQQAMLAVAIGTAVMFGAGLALPVMTCNDAYWYTASARGWTHHDLNPYGNSPLDRPDGPLYGYLDPTSQDHPTPYGPLATVASALPVLFLDGPERQVFGQRLLAVLAYILGGLILALTLSRRRSLHESRLFAAFWFLNPLAVIEISSSGHNEGLLVLFLAVFVSGLLNKKPTRAVLGLTAAIMTKTWPLILLPALSHIRKRPYRRWLHAIAAGAALALLALLPFAADLESLRVLFQHFDRHAPQLFGPGLSLLYFLMLELTPTVGQAALYAKSAVAILAPWIVGGLTMRSLGKRMPADWLPISLFLVFLAFTPWLMPWYWVAAFPLLALLKPKSLGVGFVLVWIVAALGYDTLWLLACAATATIGWLTPTVWRLLIPSGNTGS